MTDTMASKSRKTKAKSHRLFPDELIDHCKPQVQDKDKGSVLGESGLAGPAQETVGRAYAGRGTEPLPTAEAVQAAGNHRNGTRPKIIITPGRLTPSNLCEMCR